MTIEGVVYRVLESESGSSSRGRWIKQEVVIETLGEYPKKVCLLFWGDMTDKSKELHEGLQIKAHINVESREYNNRWYTEVKVWRVEVV